MNDVIPELEAAVAGTDPWALLGSLLAQNPHPLQVCSPDGRTLYVNAAYLRVFGAAPPPAANVVEDGVLAACGLSEHLRRAFAGERLEMPAFWCQRPEEETGPASGAQPFYLRLHAYPLCDAVGVVKLVVLQFEDLTAQRTTLDEKDLLLGEREAVLRQSPQGVIIADEQGRFRLVNEAAARIFGGGPPAESIADWSVYRILRADGTPAPPEERPLGRALHGETVEAEEVAFERFDGSRGMLLIGAAPLRDGDGRIIGAVSVFTDVTRFRELERLRDEFLAVAAHELRTPLTTLLGYTQLLARRLANGAPREHLEPSAANILRSGRRLELLVNQLLDVSRLERGTLTLLRAPCDLAALARQAVEEMTFRVTGTDFVVDAPPALAGDWDAGRLEQVLLNLLDNAVKHGERGTPVTLRLREDGERVTVVVEHEGYSLDDTAFPHLFDRYYRPRRDQGEGPGMGLGLYMAREIVEAHGGQISATNRPEGGFAVTITLPRESPAGSRSS